MFGLPEYLLVQALCGPVGATTRADRVVLEIDGEMLSRLIEAGAHSGDVAETGSWADSVVEELALVLDGPDPWWRACCLCADAAGRLDDVASQALYGPVVFDLTAA